MFFAFCNTFVICVVLGVSTPLKVDMLIKGINSPLSYIIMLLNISHVGCRDMCSI